MDIATSLMFLIVFGYFLFKFVHVLMKMKQPIMLPANEAERKTIRKQPQRPLDAPIYDQQKTGIITHVVVLFFVFAMYISGFIFDFMGWPQYVMLLVICLLPSSYNLLNLFAVTSDGFLSGSRFIAWKKIKSFQFVPININHRYYGHDKAINDTYELKVKTALFPTSVVVISREMKDKLQRVLNEHGVYENGGSMEEGPRSG